MLLEKIVFNIKKHLFHLYISLRKNLSFVGEGPDFIIIGAQKAGTSSLFYYLEQHPSIGRTLKKEIHFFNKYYFRDLKWYKAFFETKKNGKKIFGEATPDYLFHPNAAERVKKHFPNVKLIVMLRDPIERTISNYYMELNRKRETALTFKEALEQEEIRIQNINEECFNDPKYFNFNRYYFSYKGRSKYYDQIEKWLQYFPKSQFIFIKSEDFFEKPKLILDKVHSFLKIPSFLPSNLKPKNVGSYHYKTDEQTINQLNKIFYKEYNQLSDLIGINFKVYR